MILRRVGGHDSSTVGWGREGTFENYLKKDKVQGGCNKNVSDILLTKMLLLSVYTRRTIEVRHMVMS